MAVAQTFPASLRIVRRSCIDSTPAFRAPPRRASWFDPFFNGDVWLVCRDGEQVDLMFDQFRVARIRGTTLDVMSLNHLAFSLRHRLPRRVRRDPRPARAKKPDPAR